MAILVGCSQKPRVPTFKDASVAKKLILIGNTYTAENLKQIFQFLDQKGELEPFREFFYSLDDPTLEFLAKWVSKAIIQPNQDVIALLKNAVDTQLFSYLNKTTRQLMTRSPTSWRDLVHWLLEQSDLTQQLRNHFFVLEPVLMNSLKRNLGSVRSELPKMEAWIQDLNALVTHPEFESKFSRVLSSFSNQKTFAEILQTVQDLCSLKTPDFWTVFAEQFGFFFKGYPPEELTFWYPRVEFATKQLAEMNQLSLFVHFLTQVNRGSSEIIKTLFSFDERLWDVFSQVIRPNLMLFFSARLMEETVLSHELSFETFKTLPRKGPEPSKTFVQLFQRARDFWRAQNVFLKDSKPWLLRNIETVQLLLSYLWVSELERFAAENSLELEGIKSEVEWRSLAHRRRFNFKERTLSMVKDGKWAEPMMDDFRGLLTPTEQSDFEKRVAQFSEDELRIVFPAYRRQTLKDVLSLRLRIADQTIPFDGGMNYFLLANQFGQFALWKDSLQKLNLVELLHQVIQSSPPEILQRYLKVAVGYMELGNFSADQKEALLKLFPTVQKPVTVAVDSIFVLKDLIDPRKKAFSLFEGYQRLIKNISSFKFIGPTLEFFDEVQLFEKNKNSPARYPAFSYLYENPEPLGHLIKNLLRDSQMIDALGEGLQRLVDRPSDEVKSAVRWYKTLWGTYSIPMIELLNHSDFSSPDGEILTVQGYEWWKNLLSLPETPLTWFALKQKGVISRSTLRKFRTMLNDGSLSRVLYLATWVHHEPLQNLANGLLNLLQSGEFKEALDFLEALSLEKT